VIDRDNIQSNSNNALDQLMADHDIHELVTDLHSHLKATEELDIDHRANRWLGEAESVAADITGEDVSDRVIEKRVAQIEELLRSIDETENKEADEHISVSLSIVESVQKHL
jgi:hypothetical protein